MWEFSRDEDKAALQTATIRFFEMKLLRGQKKKRKRKNN